MPTLLSDPTRTMYIVFGAMVVILGAMALRRQKKSDVITFVIAAALLLILYFIDRAYESPREQVGRKIKEMKEASQSKKYDDLFKHVSDSFKYKNLDKKWLREKAREAEQYFEGIEAWDYDDRNDFKIIDDMTVQQGFLVQPKNSNNPAFQRYVVATFKKEGEEWRLITFALYDPLKRTNDVEQPIPGGGGP
jgi:hypothetical protein